MNKCFDNYSVRCSPPLNIDRALMSLPCFSAIEKAECGKDNKKAAQWAAF